VGVQVQVGPVRDRWEWFLRRCLLGGEGEGIRSFMGFMGRFWMSIEGENLMSGLDEY
jgi:hypothetical protein